jgi:hypothetical protein
MRVIFLLSFFFFTNLKLLQAQIVINEGCNKNYTNSFDEDGDPSDWIELYNSGTSAVNLSGYGLTDNPSNPHKWTFNNLTINPGTYKLIYCSGKDRFKTAPFSPAVNVSNYIPFSGWNTHTFATPYNWDGVSNLVFNVCAYNNSGYTQNSIFKQTATSYVSTAFAVNDGNESSCSNPLAGLYYQRPNLKINGITLDFGTIQNSATDYPAPYGNWYWCSRHQIMIRANELLAAGITAGPINSLAFEVVSSSGELYTYVDISVTSSTQTELTADFIPVQGYAYHTNFKISATGETVYLNDPTGSNISLLTVNSPQTDISVGRQPNGTSASFWLTPTPNSSNNLVATFTDTLKQPIITKPAGIYQSVFYIQAINPNDTTISKLVYTIDGSTPTINSPKFTDSILVFQSCSMRFQVFPKTANGYLPSKEKITSYVFNVAHSTPILLVTTDANNLYGPQGIFDNFTSDWIKAAHVTWLTKETGHNQLFTSNVAMRMDGGAGGSRSQPQHSFRLSFDHSTLGEQPIIQPLIPRLPARNKYSDVYLRNGSNQYLNFPQKDACQTYLMSKGTNNYFSNMVPVSVYINGQYFGLYELREKFNVEYFDEREQVIDDSVEILSLSYFYGGVLRALQGDVDHFYYSYGLFDALDPSQSNYVELADQYFDLNHYTDYIISESWMGNVDWPSNNIKIYRSNKSNYRWRFGLIDLELSMAPNGWTSCTDNHIRYMLDQSTGNPFINIWLQSIQNLKYKNYFINRFADQMNTSYLIDTLLATETIFYNEMVVEMPKEFARWGDPNNVPGQMANFINNHSVFQQQLACRNEEVRTDLLNEFQLNKKVQVKMDVWPPLSGRIHLNTIEPKQYPWEGTYYDGVPIQLTAVADSGYSFVKWLPNSFIVDTLNPTFETNVSVDTTLFTAIFKLIPPPPDGPTIHFNLYPIPSLSEITVAHDNLTIAKNCSIQIYDLNGRKVYEGIFDPLSKKTTVNISSFDASVYLLKISNNLDVSETLKFIKL